MTVTNMDHKPGNSDILTIVAIGFAEIYAARD